MALANMDIRSILRENRITKIITKAILMLSLAMNLNCPALRSTLISTPA